MFSIYSAGFSECSLAPSSPGERLADLWVLPWLLEAIRDTGLGGLLARLRDLHLAASRCRLAVTRLLLLPTAEAWSHHTLSSSLQAQYCSCLPVLSQLSGTRTPADSSDVLEPGFLSRPVGCRTHWRAPLLRDVPMCLSQVLASLCFALSPKSQAWKGSSLLQRPPLPNNSSLPETLLVLDQT